MKLYPQLDVWPSGLIIWDAPAHGQPDETQISAAPSTPGYVGVYQFVAVTVWGLVGLWRLQVSPAGLRQSGGAEGN